MQIEGQWVFNILVISLVGLIGYIYRGQVDRIKEAFDRIKAIEKGFSDMRVELHLQYVRNGDFKAALDEVKSMLRDIFEELKQKQDKP